MTIQMLFDAWQASGAFASVEAPATEAEIQAAEEKIGTTLPQPLREIYSLFNGRWAFDLDFYPLNFPLNIQRWHWPMQMRSITNTGGISQERFDYLQGTVVVVRLASGSPKRAIRFLAIRL